MAGRHFRFALYALLIMLCALHSTAYTHDVKNSTGPGVGIDLSTNYATISARFPNGTYLDIAKIEGSPAYKAYMLGNITDPKVISTPKFCPFAQKVCGNWPFKTTKEINPLAPMFTALVAAAEPALDVKLNAAVVSVFDRDRFLVRPEVWFGFERNIKTALRAHGIRQLGNMPTASWPIIQVLNVDWVTGSCIAPYEIGASTQRCDTDKIILGVDSSRDYVAISLALGDREAMETMNQWGFQRNATVVHKSNYYEEVAEGIDQMIVQAGKWYKWLAAEQEIDVVYLIGEKIDPEIQRALRDVLSERFSQGGLVSFSMLQEFSPDPVFTAARAGVHAWETLVKTWDNWSCVQHEDL